MSSPLFTSEELRVVAMNTSSRRGKSVARRRLIWRWFAWVLWSVLLPLIGLATAVAVLAGFAAREYFGHEAAYNDAQTWVQEQLGPFKPATSIQISTSPNRSNNTSMIPLTDEATPDLYLDRNLTIKVKP